MPRRMEVGSLRGLCISFLKTNIRPWIHVDRPYDNLPSHLLNETFEEIEARLLGKIAGPGISKLSIIFDDYLYGLYQYPREPVLNHYLDASLGLCVNIVDLTIKDYKGDISLFNERFPLLEKLQKLYIEDVDINSSTLRVISQCCPVLQSLDIHGCCSITDASMRSLVRKTSSGSYTCSDLKVLDVTDTAVSWRGLYHVLKYVPNLTDIKSEHLAKAIRKFYSDHKYSPEVTDLDLTVIRFSLESNPKDIAVCLRRCPNLKHVTISADRLPEEKFEDLIASLNRLESLKVIPFPEFGLLVDYSFLLPRVGMNLTELDIEVDSSFVRAIGILCPSLSRLTLSIVCNDPVERCDEPLFGNLKYLSISQPGYDADCDTFDINVLAMLLDHCLELTQLKLFIRLGTVNGRSILDQLGEKNPFSALKHISFGQLVYVMKFMTRCPVLEEIKIDPNTEHMLQNDWHDYCKEIKEQINGQGWDIKSGYY